ncbi:MAG TPA: hypothetical protein VMU03_06410, partial [Gammaproteobacteria bacterium]|nr:hypothetical protein [Gammaproteobacteria bacterium]
RRSAKMGTFRFSTDVQRNLQMLGGEKRNVPIFTACRGNPVWAFAAERRAIRDANYSSTT